MQDLKQNSFQSRKVSITLKKPREVAETPKKLNKSTADMSFLQKIKETERDSSESTKVMKMHEEEKTEREIATKEIEGLLWHKKNNKVWQKFYCTVKQNLLLFKQREDYLKALKPVLVFPL